MTSGAGRRRVVLAVPPELVASVPARRVMFTTPGRWKCGKWVPPVDHVVREAYACCVGREERRRPPVPPHEWVVARFFDSKPRAWRFYSELDPARGRALVLLECSDVVLVHGATGDEL